MVWSKIFIIPINMHNGLMVDKAKYYVSQYFLHILISIIIFSILCHYSPIADNIWQRRFEYQ